MQCNFIPIKPTGLPATLANAAPEPDRFLLHSVPRLPRPGSDRCIRALGHAGRWPGNDRRCPALGPWTVSSPQGPVCLCSEQRCDCRGRGSAGAGSSEQELREMVSTPRAWAGSGDPPSSLPAGSSGNGRANLKPGFGKRCFLSIYSR